MKRPWTDKEDAALARMYPDTPTREIASVLGRSLSSVYQHALGIGLKKNAEYMQSEKARASKALNDGGIKHRFSKGHATWNKGMKGLDIGGKETRFKSGHKPVNTWKPIGTERIDKDGFVWRKVSDTGVKRNDWVCAHVQLWEQHNGPVPAGHVVKFKDGETTRIVIENLECIDRAELMRRNSVHRLPKELAELCQLRGALNRQINRREHEQG